MPIAATPTATIGSLFKIKKKKKKSNEPIAALLNTYKRDYRFNL